MSTDRRGFVKQTAAGLAVASGLGLREAGAPAEAPVAGFEDLPIPYFGAKRRPRLGFSRE